jgi:hypothetical protein
MSTPYPFSEQFGRMLREVPDHYSLAEWQYLYRQVIYSMGMRILERFPQEFLAPDPFVVARGPAPPPPPPILQGRPPWEPGAAGLAGVVLGIPPPPPSK